MHAWVAIGLALAGCSDDGSALDATADAGDASAPDTGTIRDSAASDAGPIVDPALFDCTSPGATDPSMLPERTSAIPASCALDVECHTPEVSAHRGAGGPIGRVAPEDTLAAYRAGIVLGVEFVETDPRPTSDGVLVNIHDPRVDRTTDGMGVVEEMTFDEVRALHITTDLPGDYSCERVPTLEEILRTCRGRAVVLVDANKTDRVDLLVDAIHAADAVEWAVFDTSSLDKIDEALALDPTLHFMIRPDSVDQIEPQMDHYAPALPVIVELNVTDVDAGVPIVHARGTRALSDVFAADVLYNTTADPQGYADVLDAGLDILQSDRADVVIDFLRSRGDR